ATLTRTPQEPSIYLDAAYRAEINRRNQIKGQSPLPNAIPFEPNTVSPRPILAPHEWPIDRTNQVTVQGTVTAFTWGNPHVMIAIDVQANGTIEKWEGGGSSPPFMAAWGGDHEALKAGGGSAVT